MLASAAVFNRNVRYESGNDTAAWFENAGQVFWLGDFDESAQALFADFQPVPMQQYDGPESFADAVNNFMLFFQDGLGEYYRLKPSYQRFEALYPDFASSLCADMAPHGGNFTDLEKFTQLKLLRAYELMSTLVSEKDPFARDSNGALDSDYLTR